MNSTSSESSWYDLCCKKSCLETMHLVKKKKDVLMLQVMKASLLSLQDVLKASVEAAAHGHTDAVIYFIN